MQLISCIITIGLTNFNSAEDGKTIAPPYPVLKYKPYILTTNGVWDEGETFEDNASDTSVIKFNNSAEHFSSSFNFKLLLVK